MRLYWPRIVHQGEIEDEAETWQGLFEREKRALLRPLLQIIVAALILAGLLKLVHWFSPEWDVSILAGLLKLLHWFSLEWFGSVRAYELRGFIQLLVFLSLAVVVLLRRSRLSESGLFQGLWLLL